jgi:hypothetical protein
MSTTLRGDLIRRRDGALVHIEIPPLPATIELSGRSFKAKHEFHVTLLGRQILRRAGLLGAAATETSIRHAARGKTFTVELCDDLWILIEGEAATIIRMCNVAGAEDFFVCFESETGMSVERPPYHVTLYTTATSTGIGIASKADLERCGQRLPAAQSDELLRSIT